MVCSHKHEYVAWYKTQYLHYQMFNARKEGETSFIYKCMYIVDSSVW
jgi:hypothetical protein